MTAGGGSVVRGLLGAVGPVAAVLLETRFCCLPAGSWSVFIVAGAGAIGVVAGSIAILRGDRIAGLILVLLNAPLLALYGFLALFFGLGGSR